MTSYADGGLAGRYLKSLAVAKGDRLGAAAYASSQPWLDRDAVAAEHQKAAVSPSTTSDGGVLTTGTVQDNFFASYRPRAIVSRLPLALTVKDKTRVIDFTIGSQAWRVGEGLPKPLSSASLSGFILTAGKTVGQVVVSQELLRGLVAGGEGALTADLAAAVGQAEDFSFLSPTITGSITNGEPTLVSSGSTAALLDSDLKALFALVNPNAKAPVLITGPVEAMAISLLRGSGGALSYPGVSVSGGQLAGLPLLTSAAAAGLIVLLDQSGVILTEAEVALSSSTEASMEMSTSPSDPETATTIEISLWQANLTCLRAEVWRNWHARSGSVAYISGVAF